MHIVQLPMEMLMKIFSFLPTYTEVSLVNRLFYDIACSINDSNTQLRINHQFVDRFLSCDSMGCQRLREIQSSKRQIPSVVLEGDGDEEDPIFIGDQLSSVVIVVETFSPNIKFLKLWYVTIDVSTFLGVLSMVQNLERLELFTVDCPSGHQSSHKRSKRDYCGDLDLKNLRNLSIKWSDGKFLAVFNCLPIGVLTELKIFHFRWKVLMTVLSRQWNIKKLSFGFVEAASGDEFKIEKLDDLALDNFGKLTLESLSVFVYKMNSVSLATILSKQRNLKHLELHREAVDDTTMSAIADLAELEVLNMDLDGKTTEPEPFRKLSKLKKLKDLTFTSWDAVTLKTIADSATNSIDSLTMRGNFKLSVEVLRALVRSFPNLTRLQIVPYIPIEAQELHTILTHFNFVEVIRLHFCRAPADELGDYFNPKLRELIYFGDGEHCKSWMTKFMAAYPNIKKLTIYIDCGLGDFNPVQIAPMLKAFTKLESMFLSGDKLFVADLDCLLDGKHNLRFLQMGFLKKRTLPEVIKKFRRNFEVAKIDEEGDLCLAVDRDTMCRERKKYF